LYNIDTSTKLVIHQGLDAKKEIDLAQVKASILEDVFQREKGDTLLHQQPNKLEIEMPDIRTEMAALYPTLKSYSLIPVIVYNVDSTNRDTVTLFTGKFSKRISTAERTKLASWLKQRVKTDSVKVIIESF